MLPFLSEIAAVEFLIGTGTVAGKGIKEPKQLGHMWVLLYL